MKFNFSIRRNKTVTNYEGAKVIALTPEYELYAAVATTGLNHSFYETGDKRLERIRLLIKKCNPGFVAKLAVYARNEMYLRTIPLVLCVELAKENSGNPLLSKTVNKVIQRADEIMELLAYYQIANQRNGVKKLNRLSKQIQKGLALSFNKFDEYQFAKYNAASAVKLRDALFLVHPKAKDDVQQKLFNKIAADTLATPYTWETEFSALGKYSFENQAVKNAAFAQKWQELIVSRKLGYMALLRNLKNIVTAGVDPAYIEMACAYLSDEKAVANSKQLPFRFLAAYRELKDLKSGYTSMILDALEEAVTLSAANIKGFGTDTAVVIACDVSGSMQKPIAPASKILLYDIGLMLGMLLQSRCKNVVSGMFGDRWKVMNMPRTSVLNNVNEYYKREGEVGYATNGYLVLEDLIQRKIVADKIMLFTDGQLWNTRQANVPFATSWQRYRQLAPDAKLYLFDLAGYGQIPVDIRPDNVYLIAGWSDKVFDMLNALERTTTALTQIAAMTL